MIPMRWDGEAMVPARGFAKRCDDEFTIGLTYNLECVEERSAASHRHYFAAINEMWQTLPDHLAERFPSSEHLRKYALIRAGFATQRQFVASSKAEAMRLAAFMRPVDEYAVVSLREATVTVWTAESQSQKAMGKERFQGSKTAVLDTIASMLGIRPEDVPGRSAPVFHDSEGVAA